MVTSIRVGDMTIAGRTFLRQLGQCGRAFEIPGRTSRLGTKIEIETTTMMRNAVQRGRGGQGVVSVKGVFPQAVLVSRALLVKVNLIDSVYPVVLCHEGLRLELLKPCLVALRSAEP